MSSNSKQDVLDWMKSGSRMMGWDSIFAIHKDKADALLTQEYIRRFNTSSYLAPVNGETPPDNGYKVYMQNFILDHPRLSFDNADITSSRASLRMKILGGNQVGLKQVGGHWYPQRIDRIEPLVGPELRLRLQLSDVPGYVDDDGALTLDLKNSDDFVLTFSDSRRIRALGGEFFRDKFQNLEDHQRVWSFGRIEHGDDEVLRPDSFLLRTQRNPAVALSPMQDDDAPEVDGALLGLVRNVASEGAQNTPGPEFRYLLPDDSDAYSATVLFDRGVVMLGTLLNGLPREFFKDLELKIERADNGDLTATAVGGVIPEQEDTYVDDYQASNNSGHVHCRARVDIVARELPLKDVLKFRISKDRVSMELETVHTADAWFKDYEVISSWPDNYDVGAYFIGQWFCDVRVMIRGEWRVGDIQGGSLSVENFITSMAPHPLGNLPQKLAGDPYEGEWAAHSIWHFFWAFGLPYDAFTSTSTSGIFGALRRALYKDLGTNFYTREVVEKTIKLNFGGAILSGEQHLPSDVACFGSVAPQSTTFAVTPLEKVVSHGSKLRLATVPGQANVIWSAESVEGSPDDPGNFDQHTNGLYLAPGASSIRDAFTRVRVTATNPDTGFASSALLTVVKNALQISPLLEVCQVGDEGVSLKADTVAEGELQWRILGSQAHGRLALAAGTANTYVPGANLRGERFIVEEVEVSNRQTSESRTLCIVTQMTGNGNRPDDVIVDKLDDQLGRVWLSVSGGGQVGVSELSVVHGPGRINTDEDGKLYYQAESASPAHFCVVRAYWEPIPNWPNFSFEGFIVLPLPLGEHSQAYQTLEQAAQRATRL